MLNVDERDLRILRAILARTLPDCEIRAYGSRAEGRSHEGSDLDLAVVAPRELDPFALADLSSELKESDLPFSVDLIDWRSAPQGFRDAIERGYVTLFPAPHS
ncbi:MAG: nucleotidyltransferase domain-containing protein [Spirochaetaceae bacterium]|nr:nucleotidyltransferase domain-containing protein [Spirochaetaceae bacterium]